MRYPHIAPLVYESVEEHRSSFTCASTIASPEEAAKDPNTP